jgi:hypothetical protein
VEPHCAPGAWQLFRPSAVTASRIPGKDNEIVEVRRMFDMTDFDPETQKEIQKKFGDAMAAEMRL